MKGPSKNLVVAILDEIIPLLAQIGRSLEGVGPKELGRWRSGKNAPAPDSAGRVAKNIWTNGYRIRDSILKVIVKKVPSAPISDWSNGEEFGAWFYQLAKNASSKDRSLGSDKPIDILIWRNGLDRYLSIIDQPKPIVDLLPVRSGDRVQIKVSIGQKAFLYLLWLSTTHAPKLAYPMKPEDNEKQSVLHLPHPQADGKHGKWKFTAPGIETLLLITTREPINDSTRTELLRLLTDLPKQVHLEDSTTPHFEKWNLEERTPIRTRGIDLNAPLIPHPLEPVKRKLSQALKKRSAFVYAVCFENKG